MWPCFVTRPPDIDAVKAILDLFGQASGLLVNYTKILATILNGATEEAAMISGTLG